MDEQNKSKNEHVRKENRFPSFTLKDECRSLLTPRFILLLFG